MLLAWRRMAAGKYIAAGHLVRLILGLIAFLIVSLLDIRFITLFILCRHGRGAGPAGLCAVYGEDFGTGAQPLVDIGNFSLHPSEIAQVAIIVFLASYLDGRSHRNLANPFG